MLSDRQVIEEILKAVHWQQENESFDEAVLRGQGLVDIQISRQWIAADQEASDRHINLVSYRQALYEGRAKIQKLRNQLLADNPWIDYKMVAKDDRMVLLNLDLERLSKSFEEAYKTYKVAFDLAFALSRKMISKAEKTKTPKAPKDWQHLVDYWSKKIDNVNWKLGRAIGALATAVAKRDRVMGTGRDLVESFPLGMVGGSGKAVKKLNHRKESELDRLIDAGLAATAAKDRVNSLEITLDRYYRNYNKAVDGLALEQASTNVPD